MQSRGSAARGGGAGRQSRHRARHTEAQRRRAVTRRAEPAISADGRQRPWRCRGSGLWTMDGGGRARGRTAPARMRGGTGPVTDRSRPDHKRGCDKIEPMLIYSMGVSVDGFITDREGAFEWGEPSEEQFRFHIEEVRQLGSFLCGRRLYETMLVWDTDPSLRSDEPRAEFADIWCAIPKVVFSRT